MNSIAFQVWPMSLANGTARVMGKQAMNLEYVLGMVSQRLKRGLRHNG